MCHVLKNKPDLLHQKVTIDPKEYRWTTQPPFGKGDHVTVLVTKINEVESTEDVPVFWRNLQDKITCCVTVAFNEYFSFTLWITEGQYLGDTR